MFATRPLDQALVRRLVVLKLWQARDSFDPARLMRKFEDGNDFDWDDLGQLVRRTMVIDRHRITADCARGFAFLADLTAEERVLAGDQQKPDATKNPEPLRRRRSRGRWSRSRRSRRRSSWRWCRRSRPCRGRRSRRALLRGPKRRRRAAHDRSGSSSLAVYRQHQRDQHEQNGRHRRGLRQHRGARPCAERRLTAVAAERARNISTTALLEQDHQR